MEVFLERVRGIGPLASAWKAEVLPLYDTRILKIFNLQIPIFNQILIYKFENVQCRGAEIRTRTTWSQTKRATITQRPVSEC